MDFLEVKDELRYLNNGDLDNFATNWRKVEPGLRSYAAKKQTSSSVILDRLRAAQAAKFFVKIDKKSIHFRSDVASLEDKV